MPARSGLGFGIHASPEGKDFDTLKALCQTAERLNYDLFTVTDHFMIKHIGGFGVFIGILFGILYVAYIKK